MHALRNSPWTHLMPYEALVALGAVLVAAGSERIPSAWAGLS